jgi:Arc/MetJ-type ribon-helix-helix transcriptional regulator
MEKILICVPDEMVEWVREKAKQRECTLSEVFRRGIELLQPEWSKKEVKKIKKLTSNAEDY